MTDEEELATLLWTVMFRREPFEVEPELHDGDEWYGEPIDLARQLLAAGIRHVVAPCDLGRNHDGSCWYESGTDDD